MRYYVDTEFNGNGGQLLSIALVRQDGVGFYQELHVHEILQPWVAEHVLPLMNRPRVSRANCTAALREYLGRDSGVHTFVADWPEDLEHLCSLMIVGDRRRINPPVSFRTVLLNLPGFNTSQHSKRPHYAMDDAEALMAFVERGITEGSKGELVEGDLLLLRGT